MHPSFEDLLDVRDGEGRPDTAAHVASCARCAAEVERMTSLASALRDLPPIDPPTDGWAAVRAQLEGGRRRRRLSAGAGVALALAASLAMVLLLPKGTSVPPAGLFVGVPPVALDDAEVAKVSELMEESQRLEEMLRSVGSRGRVVNGLESIAATDLEYEIGLIDAKLAGPRTVRLSSKETARLWEQRVHLMNDLVRVRGARPAYVGF